MTTATEAPSPLLVDVPADLVAGPLEDFGPRPGADSGDPHISARVFFRDDTTPLEFGVWAATPGGRSTGGGPGGETVQILSGRARLTDAGGRAVELGAGDVLVLPRGWSGRWDVLEPVRKLYIIVR